MSCFICLDDSIPQMERLCETCIDSTICKDCLKEIDKSDRLFVLMNCPMCRKPTRLNKPYSLNPGWHIFLMFYWYMVELNVPSWIQLVMTMCSYRYMELTCRKINTEQDNMNPLMLRKRWKTWTNATFIPYVIATWLMPFELSVGTNMNIFMFGHLGFPILSTTVLYMVKVSLYVICRWYNL